jgi:hypothetical protein
LAASSVKPKRTSPLWSPFNAWADQPVLHHPGILERPDERQQPLVFNTLGDLTHQFVVIDSVEKLLQIKINDPITTRSASTGSPR